MRQTIIASLLVIVAYMLAVADEPKDKSSSAGEEYRALLEEYREVRRPREFAGKFLDLAAKYPRDVIALEALTWVLTNDPAGPAAARAVDVVLKDHLGSGRLADLCARLGQTQSLAAERLLRGVLEKSPDREVRGAAHLHLSALLAHQAAMLSSQPDQRKRLEQFHGPQYVKHLAELDPEKLSAQREKLLEAVLKSYADVKLARGTAGEAAEKELFDIRHLSIGRTAPEIEGRDLDGVKFKLSDYRGKVVMLNFWGDW